MQELLKAISALVSIVSADRVAALAARISNLDASKGGSLSANVQSAQASDALRTLIEAWRSSTTDGRTLAAMLLAASDAYRLAESSQQVELVWTGPTTELVPARRTEQALIQVIDAARQRLFITSANLTGYAMDQNMEAGVLVSGKQLPDQLHRHLEALVVTGVIAPAGV